MAETGKKVEVRYGAFACSIEGYDNPVEQMREIIAMMQQMINETPQLGTTAPDFDANEVENILNGSDAGAADGETPGLIVIRNDDKSDNQPDEIDDVAADLSPVDQDNAFADTTPSDVQEAPLAVDALADDASNLASDDSDGMETADQPDSMPTIDLSAGLQSMAPVIPTVLDGLIPSTTPSSAGTNNADATRPEQSRFDVPDPVGKQATTDTSTAQRDDTDADPDLQDPANFEAEIIEHNVRPDAREPSIDTPEPLNIFAAHVDPEPPAQTDSDDTPERDMQPHTALAPMPESAPTPVNIFSAPVAPDSNLEPDVAVTSADNTGPALREEARSHATPPARDELQPAKAVNIFSKPIEEPNTADPMDYSTVADTAPPRAQDSTSDQAARPFNIFTAPEEAGQLPVAASGDRLDEGPATLQNPPITEPSSQNTDHQALPTDVDYSLSAVESDQPFSFADEVAEPKDATVDLEAWPDAISEVDRATDRAEMPESEPDPLARPLTRDKPRNIFAAPYHEPVRGTVGSVSNAQQTEQAPADDGWAVPEHAEPTDVTAEQDRAATAAPLFSAAEQDAQHLAQQAAEDRADQALEEARRHTAGSGSRFDALLSRIHGQSSMGAPGEPSQSGNEEAALGDVSDISPADLAQRANAGSVEDLLTTAAGWLTLVKGRDRFTRREVMTVFEDLPGDHPRTLEARIKGYGKLVRNGTLILVDDGVFAMAQPLRDHFRSMIT